MENPKPHPLVVFLPLTLGLTSALLLAAMAIAGAGGFSGLFGPATGGLYHLIGIGAALLSLGGLVMWFVLPKEYRKSKIFAGGVLLNFFMSVWGVFL